MTEPPLRGLLRSRKNSCRKNLTNDCALSEARSVSDGWAPRRSRSGLLIKFF